MIATDVDAAIHVVIAIPLTFAVLFLLVYVLARLAVRRPAGGPADPPGLRTAVTFIVAGKDRSEDERAILEKVLHGVRERGLDAGEITQEDWGAFFELRTAPRLQVCAGDRGDGDGAIYVGPLDRPVPDGEGSRRLLRAIHESLRALPGIEHIAWHRREDFEAGREDRGAPEPIIG